MRQIIIVRDDEKCINGGWIIPVGISLDDAEMDIREAIEAVSDRDPDEWNYDDVTKQLSPKYEQVELSVMYE